MGDSEKRTSLRQAQCKLNIERSTFNDEVDPAPASAGVTILRGDDKSRCEYCTYSMPLNGARKQTIICANKAGEEGEWWQVRRGGVCGNFGNNGHTPTKLKKALAEGAKLIPLTQGKVAIVDAADYERVSKYKWYAKKGWRTYYAVRGVRVYKNGKYVRVRQIPMHRWLMKAPAEKLVDHRNHNGLNNRRGNLRPATPRENAQNRQAKITSRSGLKGVYRRKGSDVFEAAINHKGKRIYLGRFKRKEDAARAYDKKARELFGEFAFLNFPEGF